MRVGVNLYLQIDGDIDEYYDELEKRGVKIAVEIKDEPYGTLKSCDEVLNGMANFMMRSQNMAIETAESAAREYMSKMPAWNGH